MAEVISHDHADSGSGFGFLLGTLLIVALLALLFFWGLPMLRNTGPTQGTTPGVNINTPQVPSQ